jgi:DNA gyrase/topoisomerase IV subunit A
VTENGYGKRSEISEYRVSHRGGKGIITIKTNDRNGSVVAVKEVVDVAVRAVVAAAAVVPVARRARRRSTGCPPPSSAVSSSPAR